MNAPLSSMSRVSMNSGVMMPVIFVVMSFWAKSISYAPFLDNLFHNIASSTLLEREDDWGVLLLMSHIGIGA